MFACVFIIYCVASQNLSGFSFVSAFILTDSSEGNEIAALRGTSLTLPCIPEGKRKEEPLDLATEYYWTDEKGADLLDPRFRKNEVGDLDITDLHVSDSGVYKCKVSTPLGTTLEGTTTKVFTHKLIVYELTGHKYSTYASFILGTQTVKTLQTELEDLLQNVVCQSGDLCEPVKVLFEKCQLLDVNQHKCTFDLAYSAINRLPDEKCDEECLRSAMIEQLDKAYNILKEKLQEFYEDPSSPIKPEMTSLSTHHLITCSSGFHLIPVHHKRCYPCQPGTYSGPNSSKCTLCEQGFYQEEYGKHTCDPCPEGKTTDSLGTALKDDCTEQEQTVLDKIKSGFKSIFGK